MKRYHSTFSKLNTHPYCIADRTAKIWDLESGDEILTLDGHPNNVVKVEFCEETKLVFTVSNFAVKIFDMRQGPKCIQTLTLVFSVEIYYTKNVSK